MRKNIRLWSFPNQLPLCRKLLCHLTVFYWTFFICNDLRVATGCLFLLPSSKLLLWLPYYLTPPPLFPVSLFHGCGNDIDSTFEGRSKERKERLFHKNRRKKRNKSTAEKEEEEEEAFMTQKFPNIPGIINKNLATAKTWHIFVKCINCGKPLVCRRISGSGVRAFVPRSLPLPPLPPLAARGPF